MPEAPRLRIDYRSLLLGGLSALLYASVVLSPAFLVPVQAAGARRGHGAMVAAALAAAAAVSGLQLALLYRAGAMTPAMVLMGLSVPLALLAALTLMSLPAFASVPFVYRALAAGAAAALATLPALAVAAADPSVAAAFEEAAAMAAQAMGVEVVDTGPLWTIVRSTLASAYGSAMFGLLLASSFTGSRLVRPAAVGYEPSGASPSGSPLVMPAPAPRLPAYRVPGPLVWALLASWAGILLFRVVSGPVLGAVAWNVAISLSICYGIQGFAVAGHLIGKTGLAPAARMLGPITLALLLVGGVAGLMAVGVLALLGTLETWIPFRATTEGVSP